jgi:hypothetical protein
MTRASLLKAGAAGTVLLALGGCAPATSPDAMLRSIAATMLDGALPAGPAHGLALDAAVAGVKTAIDGLPPHVQGEVAQLFGLLQFPVTRRLLAGVGPWDRADHPEVAAFLNRWRSSRLTLFRSGYQALHQLVMAGWYGQNAAWSRIGYPGPPHLA